MDIITEPHEFEGKLRLFKGTISTHCHGTDWIAIDFWKECDA